jgi:hypothetical protein
MSTRNQSLEQRVQEHEASLLRLESAATKHTTDMVTMKTQMDEILKNLQILTNNHLNSSVKGSNGSSSSSGADNLVNKSNNQLTKMDFPKFEGENVEGWTCKVEHLFAIDATPEQYKVRYAIVHLEGIALLWHQSFVQSRGGSIEGMLWPEYKKFIIARFGDVMGQDAMGYLASLKQSGTLKDLCQEFDLALTKVSIPDEYAVSLFLRAVKPEIGYPLRLLRPRNLPEAYMLARIQDEAIGVVTARGGNKSNRPYTQYSNYKTGDYNPRGAVTATASNLPLLLAPSVKPKSFTMEVD